MFGKKRFKRVALPLIAVVVGLSMAACTASSQNNGADDISQTFDAAVSSALLSDEIKGQYAEGECAAEGHIILGSEETADGVVKVYALTMTGNYGFINDNFEKVSGTGIIPAVITLREQAGSYESEGIEFPLDGSLYAGSVKEMFPAQYVERAMKQDDADRTELQQQESAYAAAYLKKIGREAAIGDHRDFEHVLLTELGVSVEASNRIVEMKELGDYPYWVGTQEYLRDGVRYIYSMERIEIDALTGERCN